MWNPGDTHGQYELIRRLDALQGEGGTWEAIRTDASGASERVCLRRVLHFAGWDEQFAQLVEREAQAASKLRHANIASILDIGRFEDAPYVAFEFIDGVELSELLPSDEAARWPQRLVVQVGLDLARALKHAHGHGVVHGAVHPANVLLSRSGEVKLTDFGIAAPLLVKPEEAARLVRWLTYKAPEALRMHALDQIDARADLFALGVILFDMLAGRSPFEAGNVVQSVTRILNGDHLSLTELAPDAPRKLRKMIEKAIEPERDSRVESASSMIKVLQRFAAPVEPTRLELVRLVRKSH